MKFGELNSSIFDSLYDGVLIADKDNNVVYVNPAYTRITKVEAKDIIGRKIGDVRIGSRLPEVIKSGEKLLGIKRSVNNVEYFVNMVPVFENGEVVAGISILNEINDIYKLMEELNNSKRIIKDLKKKIKANDKAKYTFDSIIGEDTKTEELKKFGKKIAKKKVNILITGESGTGKELLAQAIHNGSDRRDEPFIAINCATFEANFLESELFGYEEGAFTGAKKGGKMGLFQKAEGGTIFLDEISEMDYNLQARLLRVLQENIIRPIGAINEISIDVRIIAATNRNLENMIINKEFRADLYYIIAVFTIDTIPLRERKGDIEPLINYFLGESEQKFNKKVKLSEEAFNVLYNYKWEGNVRELKNIIEFGVMMTDEALIRVEHLPKKLQIEGIKESVINVRLLKDAVREFEEKEINKVIDIYGNTLEGKKKAAEALGISLASLYNKMQNLR
ncbi:sigma-54 interaction domain-containing protein [Clostridium saccharoperbutylacetonicum]|uniref:Sigma54 specific transcriptional regulator, Fis family n=1 Tax=Clostridium saccharoperbutylacetonicum N1-4(HMT) TaxID=931276 RepID=M1MFS7_9CLOT|nr:sigma 54-interacting transcriptional regulator [Clostridium saccharoperbutylacetonicum]AGF56749.1 sigma54 specific transcriptional regulator, Fis family [Clostridium saccharoperbutylacetonicum N1-4(HMT)]NRT62496.1 PAS domain S-box-containing protein [Clostridium saccharoperbutylacetonicum]